MCTSKRFININFALPVNRSKVKKNILQFNIDFKNVLNIFNPAWGVAKYMNSSINEGRILSIKEIDNSGAPVFKSNVDGNTPTWTPSSGVGQCWYFQVGIRYKFN